MMNRALLFAAALALAAAAAPPAQAQTLALPATAPESLRAGQSVIVRPIVLDAIGRPTSEVRVQAWSSNTAVLDVRFASGGQRLIARAAGTVTVTWRWQRTDGQNYTQVRTMRVTAAAAPVDSVPVVLPPVDTTPPPAPAPLTVASLTFTPATALQLVAGDSARLTLVGARVRAGAVGALREATAAELAAITLSWRVSGTSASVSGSGMVRAKAVGFTLVTACAGAACEVRGVSVSAPPVVAPAVTRWVGMAPSSTSCGRTLVAGERLGVSGDTAYLVRALDSLPAWTYCVADSLAVMLDGWRGDDEVPPSTFAAGAALPVAWPAISEPDTTIRPVSLQIVHDDDSGLSASSVVLGLLGVGAVVGLLAGANAAARRGRDEEV